MVGRRRAAAMRRPTSRSTEGDLAVVRRLGEPRLQIGRRIVRIVRIEQMHPQEERRVDAAGELCTSTSQRARDHFVTAPLDGRVAILAGPAETEAGVVDVEAAIESGAVPLRGSRIERADERRGPIAVRLQQLGQIRHRRRQRRAEVVDAMERRIRAGQDRRVRHGGDRRLRVGAREDGRGLRAARRAPASARASIRGSPSDPPASCRA